MPAGASLCPGVDDHLHLTGPLSTLRVLVVDDEHAIRSTLSDALTHWEYEVTAAGGGEEALHLLKNRVFDVALVDIRMPGMDGLTLLEAIKRQDLALEVIMVTGVREVKTAVRALRLGAYDYLTKPVDLVQLSHVLRRLADHRLLKREVASLRGRLGQEMTPPDLIGLSPAIRQLRETVQQVAPSDSPILIHGETGTGKELVALSIYRLSSRARGPFVPVNCGAIPSTLLESEFFGHVRGAFTGAVSDAPGLFRSADGGTLFLDEVTELPPSLQAKLLRVLEDRQIRPVGSARSFPVDVRVVAATNRSIEDALGERSLRQDFFYRIAVVRIEVPPLRERKEDIPALVTHFIRKLNARLGRDVNGITPQALATLMTYDFPGNVRELENVIERAYTLGARDEISMENLPTLMAGAVATSVPRSVPPLAEAERALILRAVETFQTKEEAAKALGISPRTLYRRLREYGAL